MNFEEKKNRKGTREREREIFRRGYRLIVEGEKVNINQVSTIVLLSRIVRTQYPGNKIIITRSLFLDNNRSIVESYPLAPDE